MYELKGVGSGRQGILNSHARYNSSYSYGGYLRVFFISTSLKSFSALLSIDKEYSIVVDC